MICVNKEQTSLVPHPSGDKMMLAAEASTLGLKPGEWPDFISVINSAGEGLLFQRERPSRTGGEFDGYWYVTQHGTYLHVLND